MKDTLTRALTGIAFLAVMISAMVWAEWSCILLFLVICTVGNWEYLVLQEHVSMYKKVWGVIITPFVFIGSIWVETEPSILLLVLLAVPFIFLSAVVLPKNRNHLSDWSHLVFGQVYVTLPFVLLFYLATLYDYYDWKIPLTFFILLWLSDTGAYVVGKSLGRHKLLPKVSPKKTWEGLAGGVICSLIGAYVLTKFEMTIPHIHWALLAVMVAVIGLLGDLFESQMKRNKGVKDSGNFMPGHGGMLDRFDGVLFSIPVIFALVKLLSI